MIRQIRVLLITLVRPSGAVILSHKCGDGDAECRAHHPEDRVQFAVGEPGGRGVRPEGVDGRLDGDVRDGEQDGFEAGRQTQFQLELQKVAMKTDLLEATDAGSRRSA